MLCTCNMHHPSRVWVFQVVSSGFPTKILYAFWFTPMRATCPAHLILLGVIFGMILGEQYKS
jgi:hypothetical protein